MKNRELIIKMLGFDADTYDMNILEYSYQFLEAKGYSEMVIQELHQCPAYWIWWRNQFAIADALFINIQNVFKMAHHSRLQLLDTYRKCHVNSIIFPGKIIEKINQKTLVK